MSETPRLVKAPLPICGKVSLHGEVCTWRPHSTRRRHSFQRHYAPVWEAPRLHEAETVQTQGRPA